MNHEHYMHRCLELAQMGRGTAHPNPLVGCVIVESDEIIGEGWHRKAGEPHAEINAIESVRDKSRLKLATIYVNLEPCAHFGRTPPCADRIVSEKIPNVVIGTIDPYASVSGRGIERLKKKGHEVTVGVLEAECLELNKAFFTFHKEKRPYITLKWAKSSDGFIAPLDSNRTPNSPFWITGPKSKQQVHKLRTQVDGILVGGKTVVMDNPSLTAREWPGKNPQRIIWTTRPLDSQNTVMNDGQSTWVVGPNANTYGYSAPIEAWNAFTAMELLHELFEKDIVHLLIEGGERTLSRFIEDDLWDEAYILTGESTFQTGISSPPLHRAKRMESWKVDGDLWERFERI